MRLEPPRLRGSGSLPERVTYLERYLYRLVAELQADLAARQSPAQTPSDSRKGGT